ncbi:hypothetical protein ACWDO6_33770 [Streptomyces sp. NPDC003674]|uniref:hypothetical protein n=1 Tax=Streptomyces sp. NPDC001037 TaxID=3364542 RepID=UPI0036A3CD28
MRWNPDGTAQELPVLPGGTAGRANGLNDDGEIVGMSGVSTAMGPRQLVPVRWKADGTVSALPALGGDDGGEATAVSGLGVVVGESTKGGLNPRAVRWTSDGVATDLGCRPAAGTRAFRPRST